MNECVAVKEVLRKLNSAVLDLPDANALVEEGVRNLQLLTDTVLSIDDAAELGKVCCCPAARSWTDDDLDWQKNSAQLFSIKALDFCSSLILEALIMALMPHKSLLTGGSGVKDSKSFKNLWKS